MKICHVCSSHSVDDGRVFGRACVTLAAKGYEVHLFARGERTEPYTERGVIIHPLPNPKNRLDRLARRSRIARMAAEVQPDLFHVHEPELLGPTIARAANRPVIWDAHESYMDVLADRDWIPRPLRPCARMAWDRIERRHVARCAAVIAATDGVASRYQSIHDKVRVVANYPDLSTWKEVSPRTPDAKTCVFTGTLDSNRGLLNVVHALAILRGRGMLMKFSVAGIDYSQHMSQLFEKAEQLGVRELINYHGVLARRQVAELVCKGGIGILPNLPYGNNLAMWPVKMFEYMAFGLPLVYSDIPNFRDIAGACGAGIAIDPREPEQIADAIEKLVQDPGLAKQMGKAGKQAVRERFNWGQESIKLLELYSEVLSTQPRI